MEKLATLVELISVISPRRAISSSTGFETVLAATWAVAPGMAVITITCGGFASGKQVLWKGGQANYSQDKKNLRLYA